MWVELQELSSITKISNIIPKLVRESVKGGQQNFNLSVLTPRFAAQQILNRFYRKFVDGFEVRPHELYFFFICQAMLI